MTVVTSFGAKTLFISVLNCQSFGEKCCLHLQGTEYYVANFHHNLEYLLYNF